MGMMKMASIMKIHLVSLVIRNNKSKKEVMHRLLRITSFIYVIWFFYC